MILQLNLRQLMPYLFINSSYVNSNTPRTICFAIFDAHINAKT